MEKKVNYFLIIALLVLFCNSVYSEDNTFLFNKGRSLKVAAPEGITDKVLGMGYDVNFNELNFQVFKGKKNTTTEATYESNYTEIKNSLEYNAYAKAFSLMKGGINKHTQKRYAVLTIYAIDKTVSFEVEGSPIGNADFYVAKIHYGWSLNYIISGESSVFNTDVSANLEKIIGVGGDLKYTTTQFNLQQELKLKGLTTKVEGVTIARSPAETLNKFQKSKNSVPILIEYKAVKDVNTRGIEWISPYFKEGTYILQSVEYKVSERKSDGKHWDAGFGRTMNPDIMVKLFLDDQEINSELGEKDSFSASINFSKQINLKSNSIIKMQFFDKDINENDFIGEAKITFEQLSKLKVSDDIDLNTNGQLQNCKIKLISK